MTEQPATSLSAPATPDGNGVGPDDPVVGQAALAVSARHRTTLEVGYAMLSGLARSQGRELHEYAALVLAAGGRLDV